MKKFTSRRHVFVVYPILASRDSPARIVYMVKLSRLAGCPGQVDRVPRVGGLPCLACKRLNASSKEMQLRTHNNCVNKLGLHYVRY